MYHAWGPGFNSRHQKKKNFLLKWSGHVRLERYSPGDGSACSLFLSHTWCLCFLFWHTLLAISIIPYVLFPVAFTLLPLSELQSFIFFLLLCHCSFLHTFSFSFYYHSVAKDCGTFRHDVETHCNGKKHWFLFGSFPSVNTFCSKLYTDACWFLIPGAELGIFCTIFAQARKTDQQNQLLHKV